MRRDANKRGDNGDKMPIMLSKPPIGNRPKTVGQAVIKPWSCKGNVCSTSKKTVADIKVSQGSWHSSGTSSDRAVHKIPSQWSGESVEFVRNGGPFPVKYAKLQYPGDMGKMVFVIGDFGVHIAPVKTSSKSRSPRT